MSEESQLDHIFPARGGGFIAYRVARPIIYRLCELRASNYDAFHALVNAAKYELPIQDIHREILINMGFIFLNGNLYSSVESVCRIGVEYSHWSKKFVMREIAAIR